MDIQATAAASALAAGMLAFRGRGAPRCGFWKRAHKVWALACCLRLTRVAPHEVAHACAVFEAQLAGYRSGSASVVITSFRLVQPRMLHDGSLKCEQRSPVYADSVISLIDSLVHWGLNCPANQEEPCWDRERSSIAAKQLLKREAELTTIWGKAGTEGPAPAVQP